MPQSTVPDTQRGVKRHSNTEKPKKSISRKNYCKDGICCFSPWRWTSNALVLCGRFLKVNALLGYLSTLILCESFQFQEKSLSCEHLSSDFLQAGSLSSLVFCKFHDRLFYGPCNIIKKDFDFSVDLCSILSPNFIQ